MTESGIDNALVEEVARAIERPLKKAFPSGVGFRDRMGLQIEITGVGFLRIDTYALARAALAASGYAEMKQEVERLREALEPFANAADIRLCGEWADDKHFGQTDVGFALTFGDLRKARGTLQRDQQGDTQ